MNNSQWSNLFQTLFYLVLVFFVVVSIALGFPILGMLNADKLFNSLGCSAPGFSEMSPCIVLGFDVSWRFAIYYLPAVGALLSPVAFFFGFWDLITFCVVLMLSFSYISKRLSSR